MLRFKEYLLEANEIVPFGYKDIQPTKTDHRDHVMGQFLSFIKKRVPSNPLHVQGVDSGILSHFHKNLDLLLGDDPKHFTELHKSLTTDDGKPERADLDHVVRALTRKAMEAHLSDLDKSKTYTPEKDDEAIASRTALQKHIFNVAELALKTRKGGPETLDEIEI